MTAQDVINAVSVDIRSVLATTGADASIIIGWVDRIHKDVLHRSPTYAKFNHAVTTVTTTANTSSYTLTPTNIRHLVQVYDRNFSRPIMDAMLAVAPFYGGSDGAAPPNISEEQVRAHGMMYEKVQAPYAVYFRYIAPQTLVLFPAPQAVWVGPVEVYYDILVTTVSAAGTTLIVPDDGLDVMAAGVNWLANQFLQRGQEAQLWMAEYEKLVKGVDIS